MKKTSKRLNQGIKLSTIIGLLSTFILLFAASAGSYISYINDREALAAQTLRLNEYHAEELSRISNTAIGSMKEALQRASIYMDVENSSPQQLQRDLEYFKNANSYFNSVVIIDENAILTQSAPNLGLANTKMTAEPVLKALSGKIPSIASPYVASTGRYLVFISQPLFSEDGEYQGMIAGTIYLKEQNRLREILGTENRKEDGSYFYVIDENGKYLYYPDEKKIGELVNDAQIEKLSITVETGAAPIQEQDGNRYLAGHADVLQTGWSVIFQTPYENVNELAKASALNTGVYLLPLTAIVLVLMLGVSNMLAKPMYTLARYIEHMANRRGPEEVPNVHDWNYETKMLKEAILLAERKTREAEAYLVREANHDQLTGLLNRRTLQNLTYEWMQHNKKFAVIFLDIDHFKSVNDTFGHQQGDEVLKVLGSILTDQVTGPNYSFRYGGEEFVILLADMNGEEAFRIAEQIRTVVAGSVMSISKSITVSLGVAVYHDESKPEVLFEKADLALYRAKESGRNRTVLFE